MDMLKTTLRDYIRYYGYTGQDKKISIDGTPETEFFPYEDEMRQFRESDDSECSELNGFRSNNEKVMYMCGEWASSNVQPFLVDSKAMMPFPEFKDKTPIQMRLSLR